MAEGPKPVGEMAPGGNRWTKTREIWIPEIDKRHRAQVETLKRELDVERRAADDAKLGQPQRHDKLLNEPQLDICNRVFSGILMLNQFLAEQLGKALETARQQKPAAIDLEDFKSRMSLEAKTVFAEGGADLARLRSADIDAHVDLRHFRSINRLRRSASYRESNLLSIGIVLSLLVVESLANGLLFRDVVSGGIVEGIFLALLVSAVNVVLGLAAGLVGWRYIGHVSIKGQIIGWLVTAAAHIAAVLWNLLVAHFREAASKALENGNFDFQLGALMNQSVAHLAEHGWLGLSSVFAWALLMLGIIVHFVAAHEGWDDLADRYPGYRKADVRAKDARAAFEEEAVEMRRDARAAATTVLENAEEATASGQRRLNSLATLEDVARQREQDVRNSEDEWVASGTQLLKLYRDCNNEVREGGTAPSYFGSYPDSEDYRRNRFSGGNDRTGEIDKHAEDARSRLLALHELKEESGLIIEANAERVIQLRAYMNELLEDLDERIEAAKTKATEDAAFGPDDENKGRTRSDESERGEQG